MAWYVTSKRSVWGWAIVTQEDRRYTPPSQYRRNTRNRATEGMKERRGEGEGEGGERGGEGRGERRKGGEREGEGEGRGRGREGNEGEERRGRGRGEGRGRGRGEGRGEGRGGERGGREGRGRGRERGEGGGREGREKEGAYIPVTMTMRSRGMVRVVSGVVAMMASSSILREDGERGTDNEDQEQKPYIGDSLKGIIVMSNVECRNLTVDPMYMYYRCTIYWYHQYIAPTVGATLFPLVATNAALPLENLHR